MKKPVIACICLAACTDPRARPAPPILQVTVSPTLVLTSPGSLLGSLYAYDSDGLDALEMSVAVFGGQFAGDSTILLEGTTEQTRSIHWELPAGIATGAPVTLISTVTDFSGFSTTDTLVVTVQDSVSGVH